MALTLCASTPGPLRTLSLLSEGCCFVFVCLPVSACRQRMFCLLRLETHLKILKCVNSSTPRAKPPTSNVEREREPTLIADGHCGARSAWRRGHNKHAHNWHSQPDSPRRSKPQPHLHDRLPPSHKQQRATRKAIADDPRACSRHVGRRELVHLLVRVQHLVRTRRLEVALRPQVREIAIVRAIRHA